MAASTTASFVDLQIGSTRRIAAALPDRRHQSYVSHSYHDILIQRIYQIGCGYEDGNGVPAGRRWRQSGSGCRHPDRWWRQTPARRQRTGPRAPPARSHRRTVALACLGGSRRSMGDFRHSTLCHMGVGAQQCVDIVRSRAPLRALKQMTNEEPTMTTTQLRRQPARMDFMNKAIAGAVKSSAICAGLLLLFAMTSGAHASSPDEVVDVIRGAPKATSAEVYLGKH